MRLLVCSDIHGELAALSRLYLSNQGFDMYICCGDQELPAADLSPFACVRGNCDWLTDDLPLVRDIRTKWGIIHVEHGHRLTRFALQPESLASHGYFLFFFGHTHARFARRIGGTYVFNPGSLTRPRDGEDGSYLIVDVADSGHVDYMFKNYRIR